MTASRELDIVLFGATGVTGIHVVEELHRASEGLRWGIAGRNADKLRYALRAAAKNLDLQDDALDSVPIIVADVADEASLLSMARRTRLVLNTVGPYRFYGRPVVKACVDSSTHHIDVSAEPQYMEQMQLEFYEEARKKGVMILSPCGFASIPAEMCLSYLRKHFQGELEEVESYMLIRQGCLGMKVNFGTWQSIIHLLAHASELRDLRRRNREKFLTKPPPQRQTQVTQRKALFWSDVAKSWCVPYMGCDRSVIIRSEMFRHQLCDSKPVQIQTYFRVPGLIRGIGLGILAFFFLLFSWFSYGRWLLERFPGVFSAGTVNRGGPSKEQALGCSFSMTMRGRGWKEKLDETGDRGQKGKMNHSVTIRLDGPDPAYVTTSMCMVQVAVVVLKEKKKMAVEGGVLSPGVALDGTSYLDRIQKRGFHMAVVSQRD
ncbi:saccharopine dehydrogenase-like oxidoreductase isoform X1 [Dermacentor andersoni]|uniref:saccharopine dehydrogenase-like oxidoreductase isoform X1 n=1 Tax=Dermacentor andersoni TaxID=34620 RepID=UPI00215587C5|nr:saccharopine dehydrogenase-like oxidoreductase isoform X1 [Dermacentor andersoni]